MFKRLKTPPPGVPGFDRKPTTDLPVLLPIAARVRQEALFERVQGTYRLNLTPRHAIWLTVAFVMVCGASQAATKAELIGPFEALFKWIPFILIGKFPEFNGFALNLIISFFAMIVGTVAGAALGLMQVSLLLPVRTGSWIVTQILPQFALAGAVVLHHAFVPV